MNYIIKLAGITVLFFIFFSTCNAETATATQSLSLHIQKVNLLAIPDSIAITLTQDNAGYYSGTGQFSYAISTNDATETKRILASIPSADFGEQGSLTITMQSPTGEIKTTLFQQGETDNKTIMENISNVAQKNIPLSITLTKLKASLIQPYTDVNSATISYPLQINYMLTN